MVSQSNENSNGNFKLPPGFNEIVKIGDKVLLVDRYTITIALLSVLASISSEVRYSLRENGNDEDAIVIYAASFQPTGIGKSSAITFFRKNVLMPLMQFREAQNCEMMIDDASAEGLEESLLAGNSPHIFLDEFGKYLQNAKKDQNKKAYISALQSIFDSGFFVTKRRRDISSTPVFVEALGAYFASTIGDSNLQPKAIAELVNDGFLGRVLMTFYDGHVPKPLPLERDMSADDLNLITQFAIKYSMLPKEKKYFFSREAICKYEKFLDEINSKRTSQIMKCDDKAGLTTRLPKYATRIATIFHLSRLAGEHIGHTYEIGKDDMLLSIDFLIDLEATHLQYILDVAKSKNGRLNHREKIVDAVQKYTQKYGDGMPYKNLQGNLHIKTSELKEPLHLLIEEGKITENGGKYYV